MSNGDYERFSQRYGFSSREGDKLIREDAPESLRCGLLQISTELKWQPSWLRQIVCGTLRVRPNPSNWSEYPNVWYETEELVHSCDWFRVYDIIEAIYAALHVKMKSDFETRVNNLLTEEDIGWGGFAGSDIKIVFSWPSGGRYQCCIK